MKTQLLINGIEVSIEGVGAEVTDAINVLTSSKGSYFRVRTEAAQKGWKTRRAGNGLAHKGKPIKFCVICGDPIVKKRHWKLCRKPKCHKTQARIIALKVRANKNVRKLEAITNKTCVLCETPISGKRRYCHYHRKEKAKEYQRIWARNHNGYQSRRLNALKNEHLPEKTEQAPTTQGEIL